MKKQDVAGLIVYVIILALAIVFGLLVIGQYNSKSGLESGQYLLFVGGAIVAGVIGNAIYFELAHMLGAKIGHYLITSVNILGFNFYREENKTKFHFKGYDGLTGETKIIPNLKNKKKANPTPYLIMGTVFYAIEVIVIVFLFSYLTREGTGQRSNNLAYFGIIVMAVGGMILLYNIIPFQLDSMTDGYRLRLVTGKKNKESFNAMLLGKTVEEIKQEQGEKVETTSFSSNIRLNQVYQLLSEDKFVEAEKEVDDIIASQGFEKASDRTKRETYIEKLYLIVMNKDLDEAMKYYDEHFTLRDRKDLSDGNTLNYIRTYVLTSGLLDRSRFECERMLKKAYKAYRHTQEEKRILESKLFNKALEKVCEKHPEWGLQDYKINAQ
ncbi:MAG: hypothetical protein K6C32_01005 [Bacilli bacterium]|nr:hypothetical protein [Bacilli bacterium]